MKVIQKPILRLPDQSKPYVLRTDASDIGLGAVLMQEADGKLFPVSFASKKLSTTQQKYSAIEKKSCSSMGGKKVPTIPLWDPLCATD